MSVKLTNFVDINITRHLMNIPTGTRNTATLVLIGGTTGTTPVPVTIQDILTDGIVTKELYEKYKTTTAFVNAISAYKDYVDAFFANGGVNLFLYNIPASKFNYTDLPVIIADLPMEYCMIGLINADGTEFRDQDLSTIKDSVIAYNDTAKKIFGKIFVAEAALVDDITEFNSEYVSNDSNLYACDNLVLKYGDLGVGAATLAYYTQFNIYTADAAQDYAYTVEKFKNVAASSGVTPKTYVIDDNEIVAAIIKYNMNCDIELAGQVRNIGGNDTNGNDLTNEFMLIVLHQTLTEQLVNLLTTKIKYNDKGMSAVINTISAELNRYVTNGFLTTNKVWTDGDLYYKNYKIISNNTLLNSGYKIVVLPYTTLSPEDIQAHKFPEIYILIADSYSIRKIVITGEVF